MRAHWSYIACVAGLGLVCGSAGATGCKGEQGSAATGAAATTSSKLSEEEEALIQRRDALLNSRRSLREKRIALAEERRRLIASGADTSEVDKRADELALEEKKLGDAEDQFHQDLDALFSQQQAFLATLGESGGEDAQLAAREAGMAAREKSLAARERRLAGREEGLADRERALAVRERETCGTAPATIIQAPAAAGSKYTKRDVEPLLRRARRAMSRRGILRSDLPAAAQGLESEATKAMESGEYGQARFAAAQLVASVEATRVDKGFIQAKIARLNSRIKGLELSDDTRKEVDDLFRDATASYGDGKFARANRQLNKIYSEVDR